MSAQPAEKAENAAVFTAADIQVLKGLDAVRKRPGMYVGDTSNGSGLHHMVYEVVEYAIYEVKLGFADEICVAINPDRSCTISDNGRGIPVDMDADDVSAAQIAMTQLHGGMFDFEHDQDMRHMASIFDFDEACKLWIARNSGGASIVNALSSWLELRIWRDDKEHFVRFRNGEADAPLAVIGPAPEGKRGTEITFRPNPEIFTNVTEFDFATLERRFREFACATPGLHITLTNARGLERKTAEMHDKREPRT